MKRAVAVVIVILAIVAAATLTAPFLIPEQFLKQQLADAIAGLTGRVVTLSGDVNLTVYPNLTVAVDGITIADPDGKSDDPLVAADQLRTRVRLLPLLAARVEFDEFDLVNPRIHVIAGSGSNWRLTRGSIVAAADATARPDAQATPAPVSIGRLVVSNGTILFDDRDAGRHEEMTAVNLDMSWANTEAPASGRGTLIWRGEAVEFTTVIGAPLALISGSASPLRFAVASTPLRATFTGKAISLIPLELDGDASLSTPSLRHAVSWLGTSMGTGAILGAAAVSGKATWNAGTIAFNSAKAELDGNSAEGTLALRLDRPRPMVQGTLAANALDLSPYAEAVQANFASAGSWLMTPAQIDFAQTFDADLRLSAAKLIVGSIAFGRTALAVAIKDGTLDVAIGEAEFHSGTIAARVNAHMEDDNLSASAHLALTNLGVGQALTDIAGVSALGGTGSATFDLTSRANLWGGFVSAITGTGEVAITDGTLGGIDVPAVAASLRDPLSQPVKGGQGQTAFKSLTATLTVDSGRLVTGDLAMTGSKYSVAAAGKGSLLSQAIDATADVTTAADTVRLVLSGTWNDPTIARAPVQPVTPDPLASPPPAAD